MLKLKFFAIIFLAIFNIGKYVNAQQNDVSLKVPDINAEKLYAKEGYQKAIDLYEKVDPKDQNPQTLLKIANSHRLNGNSVLAEKYYNLCINDGSKPEDVFNYAQVLLSNGKCKESLPYFNQCKKFTSNKNLANLISSCDELTGFSNNDHIEIMNAEGINSKWLDFCPVYYQTGLIFTSGRPNNLKVKVNDYWSGKSFSDMYFAQAKGNGKYEAPTILSLNLQSQYHDGAVSFSPDGSEMYYSSNNRSGKNKKGIKDLKIYKAKLINASWTTTDPFPFNSDEYDNCHPALSTDGNVLVFSSNMQGGFGGMDLYVSYKKDNVWTKPLNLGSQINSAGNEIFPFLDVANKLYYSSDGLKGMGGLDIFGATLKENDFFWSSPINLGQPYNSIKDDLSYITSKSREEGYFASNREGGTGEDDIYYWSIKNQFQKSDDDLLGIIPILVVDKENAEPLPEARVNLFNEKSEPFTYITNSQGKIGKDVNRQETKFVECEKDGFKPKHVYLTPDMVGNQEKSTIFMERESFQPLRGNILNRSNDYPIEGAEIIVKNLTTGAFEKLKSKPDGSYSTTLNCQHDYQIKVEKVDYLSNELDFHSNEMICRSDKSVVKDFHLTPYKINENRKKLSASFLGDESKNFEAGKSFEVKDIYYDYNKATIRSDAKKTLTKLVELLKEFPEMEIELSSHTDCRGMDSYNQKLSQKRAESAVKFLLTNGIEPSRLKAAGYGEAVLKNNCEDGVNCSETQHQENRRTEIKILKL